MMYFALFLLVTAFSLCLTLTYFSISAAKSLGVMDSPDARKVHSFPTPRLGGVGIVVGTLSTVLLSLFFPIESVSPVETTQLLALIGGTFFVFLVGLCDDIRTVSSRFKFMALLAASLMVCGSGITFDTVWLGGQPFGSLSAVSWLLTVLWIVGIAVAMNFIDGLDGLASGIALLNSVVLAAFLLYFQQNALAVVPLALAGSLAAFLIFNWHPAKTFMGDCGSLSIGFLMASMMVMSNDRIGTMRGMLVPGLALSIPILDTIFTMFRRHVEQRRSLFSAERGHVHHRLIDRGLTHHHAVIFIHAVSLLAVCIGVISLSFVGWSTLGGLSLLVPLMWGAFRFAGSIRTNNMLSAIRNKRLIDKQTRRNRSMFDELQLVFQKASSMSEWWEAVCRAAESFEFEKVELVLPRANGKCQRWNWESKSVSGWNEPGIQASVPVRLSNDEQRECCLNLHIGTKGSLEPATTKLAMFSRLVCENSLKVVEERVQKTKKTNRVIPSTAKFTRDQSEAVETVESPFGKLRVAIVHDFLYTVGGAERVLEQIINVVPHCDLFALFDFLPADQRGCIKNKPVTTTFLQHLPFAKKKHRSYLPLMPFAIEQLDLSNYDLVISSSYLAAKGVITGPDQLHVCYCHSPVRYAWDLQHQYLNRAMLGFGPRGIFARLILHYLRIVDFRSSMGVDYFLANSKFVADRIQKAYRRSSTVIYPPVNLSQFQCTENKEDFYVVAGRMVPYKQTDMIVRAFTRTPNRKLIVVGDGPEMAEVRSNAGPNVVFVGHESDEMLADYLQRARALVFAAEEDFGIIPVEALACGTPVIAFGKGGVTESVVSGEHGLFFDSQSEESLLDALDQFESQSGFGKFEPSKLRLRSEEFSSERFREAITSVLRLRVQEKFPLMKEKPIQDKKEIKEHALPEPKVVINN